MTSLLPSFALLALALALAMDAFAVSLSQGAASRSGRVSAIGVAAAFGLAQAAMPLIGWSLGVAFTVVIRSVDHWIAFVLLALLGGRMLREGLSRDEAASPRPLAGWALAGAAVATSVDAAAAGIALPLFEAPIWLACAAIGLVTGALCFVGVRIGAGAGARLGRWAEILGGLLLIGIGTKILVEHQWMGLG